MMLGIVGQKIASVDYVVNYIAKAMVVSSQYLYFMYKTPISKKSFKIKIIEISTLKLLLVVGKSPIYSILID